MASGAQFNKFEYQSSFPSPQQKAVVQPNRDTFYSTSFLNLVDGPVVLSIPSDVDRYYLLPLLDAWSNVFASPGTRTQAQGKSYLIVGPNHQNLQFINSTYLEQFELINSPTNEVFLLGRTEVQDLDDQKHVAQLERQFKLQKLEISSQILLDIENFFEKSILSDQDPATITKNYDLETFFNIANQLMLNNPPKDIDQPSLEKLAQINVGPGLTFDINEYSKFQQKTFNISKNSFYKIAESGKSSKLTPENWNFNLGLGNYSTNYLERALVAYIGFGANIPQDAVYGLTQFDKSKEQLNGKFKYKLQFGKDEIPSVNGFWSLTLYTLDGYFIDDPSINKYVVKDKDVVTNEDGSVTIWIQNESPGKEKEANWLPCLKDQNFKLNIRLYWPKSQVLNGSWTPNYIEKQD